MTKRRINWGQLKGVMLFGAMIATFGTLIAGIVKDESRKSTVRDATEVSSPESLATTRLIDSSMVEVKKGELSHIFNFDYGHVIIMGKVNDQKVDTAFTFEQFGKQDRIEQVRLQGCTIAATSLESLKDRTDKDSRKALDNARLFRQNHCPQQAPAP